MSLKAAASGFVLLLFLVSVIQSQNDWRVTYTSTKICALKETTVEIRCSYRHPSRINGHATTVEKTFWFTKMNGRVPVDLTTDSRYSGRVQDHCENNNCTLKIKDLRESDSAEYKFMFITNQLGGSFIGEPGVTLSVTDLKVDFRTFSFGSLECQSSCSLPGNVSYIWYKNGRKITEETSHSYQGSFNSIDSYSCAVKGYEVFPAPSDCVYGQTCNRVTYTNRSICALKGSSVDISCSYNSYIDDVESKFWFSPKRSHQWQNPSEPEDLSKDSQFAGRVQVIETEKGRSTLRISDLRESDSAQYHFKFITPSFEWNSSLPGTTLTVTALRVQVTRTKGCQFYAEAELKCQSSCSLAGRLSYVWFQNGEQISGMETFSYEGHNVSCAIKGLEEFPSPLVYAPKLPSVSVSPSAEIMEGSSVTLTCSSDANPAATYTWYKTNTVPQPLSKEPQLVFSSVRSSDPGEYHCTAVNELGRRTSNDIIINVKHKSTIIMNIIRLTVVVVMPTLLLLFSLMMRFRKRKTLSSTTEPNEPKETLELESGPDISVSASITVTAAQTEDTEEQEDLV